MTWTEQDNTLQTEYVFDTFIEAIAFVNHVALLAEQHEHHPDIDIRYTTVHLSLSTHDAGSVVTQKDHELAEAIDAFMQ